MKDYLHNLIAQGWVKKSNSPYASQVVCVRKKDVSLCLGIDYGELNKKTQPDRQPVPCVLSIQRVVSAAGSKINPADTIAVRAFKAKRPSNM